MAYSGRRVRKAYGRGKRGVNSKLLSTKRKYHAATYAPVKAMYNKSSSRNVPTGVRIAETERIGILGGSISTQCSGTLPTPTDVPNTVSVSPKAFHMFDLNGSMIQQTINGHQVNTDKGLIINPSLPNTFPWLSSMAALYERYKVNKLIFRYRTQARTDLPGNIVMAFEKDVHNLISDEDGVGTSTPGSPSTYISAWSKAASSSALQKLTQTTTYLDGAPWKNFTLVVPCGGKVFYTRDKVDRTFGGDSTFGFTDAASYDFGKFYLGYENIDTVSGASVQVPTVVDMGILEIDYDITFLNRRAAVVMEDPDRSEP